jgi:hypothetical protein
MLGQLLFSESAWGICSAAGEVTFHIDRGQLYVDSAEPKITIADELIAALPIVTVPPAKPGLRAWLDCSMLDPLNGSLTGALFVISAVNRRLIYVVGRYDPVIGAYHAEWPD